jgi:hypothetical protein
MKLISMVAFIRLNEIQESDFYYPITQAYANFLNQSLTLRMFIPCDLEGNVLTNPIDNKDWSNWTDAERSEICDAWEQAKERVLFEGFEIDEDGNITNGDLSYEVRDGKVMQDLDFGLFPYSLVEDMDDCNLILTESAIKQIGL